MGLRAMIANVLCFLSDKVESVMVPRPDLVLPEGKCCVEILARSPPERILEVMTNSGEALTLLEEGTAMLSCPLTSLCKAIEGIGEQMEAAKLSVPQVRASSMVLLSLRADGTIQGRTDGV